MVIKLQAPDFKIDFERHQRTGLDEAIFCDGKSAQHISSILDAVLTAKRSILLTRLSPEKWGQLPVSLKQKIDFDPISNTAFFLDPEPLRKTCDIAIISAGTSDSVVAREAVRTLAFYGYQTKLIQDIGVAGLWRLLECVDDIAQFPILIVVAGMDGALPTVLAGLIPSVVIALPTSVGYGAAEGGRTALNAALSSCSAGILAVNIDNGYGAACAAVRILTAASRSKLP